MQIQQGINYEEKWYIFLLSIIILTIIDLLVFTTAEGVAEKTGYKNHRIATGLTILFGTNMILSGTPAALYIIYTWIYRNDGNSLRGQEFEGLTGIIIIILTALSWASVFTTGMISNIIKIVQIIMLLGSLKSADENRKTLYMQRRLSHTARILDEYGRATQNKF